MLGRRALFIPHVNSETEFGYIGNSSSDNVLNFLENIASDNVTYRHYSCVCYSRRVLMKSKEWALKNRLENRIRFILTSTSGLRLVWLQFRAMFFSDLYVATPYKSVIVYKWPWQRLICLNYFSSFKNDAISDVNSVKSWDIDFALTTSLLTKQILCYSEKLNYEKVYITGFPRNDRLFNPKYNRQDMFARLGLNKDALVYMYAPTHRDQSGRDSQARFIERAFPAGENLNSLMALLNEKNAYLLIKVHPKESIPVHFRSNNRILMWKYNSDYSIYDLLPHVSLCISDYSSIVLDFMLLKKPILFYSFDIEEYRESRGLSFDPLKMWMIENTVKYLDTLVSELDRLHKTDYPSNYSEYDISEFHKYMDGAVGRIKDLVGVK